MQKTAETTLQTRQKTHEISQQSRYIFAKTYLHYGVKTCERAEKPGKNVQIPVKKSNYEIGARKNAIRDTAKHAENYAETRGETALDRWILRDKPWIIRIRDAESAPKNCRENAKKPSTDG